MILIRISSILFLVCLPLLLWQANSNFLKKIMYVLASFLLLYKLCEYGYYAYNKIPNYVVDFSTIAYFILPISIFLRKSDFRTFAGILGLLAGFFYWLSNLIYPEGFYNTTDFYLGMARINHTILYILGLIVLYLYEFKSIVKNYLGIFLIIAYSYLLKYIFEIPASRYMIYTIMCPKFISQSGNIMVYILYYLILSLIFGLIIILLKHLNKKLIKS